MKYCEHCQSLEGETLHDENDELICADCHEPITRVPEHDDYDLER